MPDMTDDELVAASGRSAEKVGFDAAVGGMWPGDIAKPNRCYETMTRVVCGEFVVRVWRTTAGLSTGPDVEVVAALQNRVSGDISKALDALPNVAAYEILNANGNGCVVYPDWH